MSALALLASLLEERPAPAVHAVATPVASPPTTPACTGPAAQQGLARCEHCQRTFRPAALMVHARICQKVFMQKATRFNIKEQRQDPEAAALQSTGHVENASVAAVAPHHSISPCRHCQRTFHYRSLTVHENVCEKVFKNKRYPFNSKERRQEWVASSAEIMSKRVRIVPYEKLRRTCRHCARTFRKPTSMTTHEHICKRVFKEKRTPFDIKKCRQTDEAAKAQRKCQRVRKIKAMSNSEPSAQRWRTADRQCRAAIRAARKGRGAPRPLQSPYSCGIAGHAIGGACHHHCHAHTHASVIPLTPLPLTPLTPLTPVTASPVESCHSTDEWTLV